MHNANTETLHRQRKRSELQKNRSELWKYADVPMCRCANVQMGNADPTNYTEFDM